MNPSSKILFVDLDGTLLNDKKEISPGTREAIAAALAQGHAIVLSSGRATSSVKALARKLSLAQEGCYAITFNGACVCDLFLEKPIYKKTLPLPLVFSFLEEAERFGIHAHTYQDGRVLAARRTGELLRYAADTRMEYLVADPASALLQEPEKLLAIDYQDHAHLLAFQRHIEPLLSGRADTFFSCPSLLETVAPGVSKGAAVRALCEHLHIPIERTVAAGDAENDISMLQAAHVGAVMKNADPSMYPYGDYITERDNNHDGVAEIIRTFLLS